MLPVLALALAACSNPHDDYVGFWKSDSAKRVIEISKEGKDTYLLDNNIFSETDRLGRPKASTVLEKKDDSTLAFNSGMMLMPYVLSEDKKTLRMSDKQYVKISEEEANKMLTNFKQCKELRDQFKAERKSFSVFASDDQQAKQDAIKEEYRKKQEAIPDCDVNIF